MHRPTIQEENERDLMTSGLELMKANDYSKTISYFQKVVIINSQNLEALHNLTQSFEILGFYEEAIDTYKKIYAQDKKIDSIYRIESNNTFGRV